MILLLILFLLGTNFFGFLPSIEGIIISKVGTLNLGHVILIFGFIISLIHWKPQRINIKDPLFSILLILLLIIFFQSLRGIFEGVGVKIIIREFKRIYMFFYIIPLIMIIKNKSQLQKFIDILLFFGFINSLVMIFQFITGTALVYSNVTVSSSGLYRIYHCNAFFVAMCLFVAISYSINIKGQKEFLKKIFIPFYIIGILTTFHRSLIIGCMIGIIFIVSINYLKKRKIKFKYIVFILIIIISSFFFLTKIGIGKAINLRMSSGIEDMKYFEGTFSQRLLLLGFKFETIITESPLLGIGFRYNPDLSADRYDPYALSADESYGNIFVFSGFIGLIVLIIWYYLIIKISLKMYNNSYYIYDRAIYLGIFSFPILYFIMGFFSRIFFFTPNLTILITATAILYLLNYFNKSENYAIIDETTDK